MPETDDPSLALALDQIGDRWSLLVIGALLNGPRRNNELAAQVVGIAPNILAARLRHLERERLLVTTPYQERPRRLAYELTQSGRELATVLGALSSWGARQHGVPERRIHEVCGTALTWRPWCPTCAAVVEGPERRERDAAADEVWM